MERGRIFPMKVGIVEDDADIAKLYEVLLADHELEIVRFARPRDALTVAAWDGVEVAVVDLMMPDVTGEEIVRFLCEHLPPIRRVIASALDPSEDLRAIVDACLRKPFSPEQLLEAIRG